MVSYCHEILNRTLCLTFWVVFPWAEKHSIVWLKLHLLNKHYWGSHQAWGIKTWMKPGLSSGSSVGSAIDKPITAKYCDKAAHFQSTRDTNKHLGLPEESKNAQEESCSRWVLKDSKNITDVVGRVILPHFPPISMPSSQELGLSHITWKKGIS